MTTQSRSRRVPHCGAADQYAAPSTCCAPGPAEIDHRPVAGNSADQPDADEANEEPLSEELSEEITRYAEAEGISWDDAKRYVFAAHKIGRKTLFTEPAQHEVELRKLSRRMDALDAANRASLNSVRESQTERIVQYATEHGVSYDEAKAMMARKPTRYGRRFSRQPVTPEFLLAVHTERLARGVCCSYDELKKEFS